jgi:hypothetical protein
MKSDYRETLARVHSLAVDAMLEAGGVRFGRPAVPPPAGRLGGDVPTPPARRPPAGPSPSPAVERRFLEAFSAAEAARMLSILDRLPADGTANPHRWGPATSSCLRQRHRAGCDRGSAGV